MKSVEQRLHEAKADLALIIAGLSVETDDLPIQREQVMEGMFMAARRAYEELHWLTYCLPVEILNTNVPSDDERDAQEGLLP